MLDETAPSRWSNLPKHQADIVHIFLSHPKVGQDALTTDKHQGH